MRYLLIIAIVSLFGMTGCATLFGDSTQNVTFNSNVEGVTITNGVQTCVTPCSLNMPRSSRTPVFHATKTGYMSQPVELSTTVNNLAFLNILGLTTVGFGLTSTGVDLATGAAWAISPNTYFIYLTPNETSSSMNERYMLQFATTNYMYIMNDAVNGGGEYTLALSQLTNINESDLINIAIDSKSPVAFAQELQGL